MRELLSDIWLEIGPFGRNLVWVGTAMAIFNVLISLLSNSLVPLVPAVLAILVVLGVLIVGFFRVP